MNKLIHGRIPECFGYGLECYAETVEDAISLLRREYKRWQRQCGFARVPYNHPEFQWPRCLGYFGATLEEVRPGLVGAENQTGKYIKFPKSLKIEEDE